MKTKRHILASILLLFTSNFAIADEDPRQMVELPKMMQQHMMANMRDHLATINEILIHMSNDRFDEAAELAESRLGMSALKSHKAGHMATFMPEAMQKLGSNMHRAASRFALKAQEGESIPAYHALSEITTSCVACHSSYRIQ
tara:strand:+ start:2495 stop:2923 length:429 start_codon:yes stop_codon:yes gene_type:complete